MFTIPLIFVELYNDKKEHIGMPESILRDISKEKSFHTFDRKALEFINNSSKFMENDLMGSVSDLDEAYEVANEIESHEIMQAFNLYSLDSMHAFIRKEIIALQIDQHMNKLDRIDNMFHKEIRKQITVKKRKLKVCITKRCSWHGTLAEAAVGGRRR